ncbi:MAG: hypothetical protein AAF432_00895 [Planctomycetota bacterium]
MAQHDGQSGPTDAELQPQAAGPTPSENGTADGAVGDQVMGILSDVEKQLDRLRQVQRDKDVEVASLKERRENIDAMESELESIRQRLKDDRLALEGERADFNQARTDLDAEKEAWSSEHEQLQSRLIERDRELSEREEAMKASMQDIEQRESALAEAQQELNEQRAAIEKERAAFGEQSQAAQAELGQLRDALKTTQGELAKRTQSLSTSAERLAALESSLTETKQQLTDAESYAEQLSSEMDEERTRLQQDNTESQRAAKHAQDRLESLLAEHGVAQNETKSLTGRIEELQAQIGALEDELARRDERMEQSASKAASLEEKLSSLQEKSSSYESDLEAREAALLEARSTISESSQRIDSLQGDLEEREALIDDHKAKLELAGEKMKEFAEAIEMQSEQIERGAVAFDTIEQQRREIDHLQSELASAKLGSDPEIVNRKDERIQELTQALRQARGQKGGNPDLDALEDRIAEQEEEIDRLRREAESAVMDAQNARRELEVQVEQINATRKDDAKQSAEVEKLHKEVVRLQGELESRPASDESEALQSKINDLEERLTEAQASAGGMDDAAIASLREKTQRLQEFASHLKRRRSRLRRLRQMLKLQVRPRNAPAPSGGPSNLNHEEVRAQLLKLEDRRRELIELRSVLAMSEKKMIRRWARPRSVLLVMWILMIASVCAGSSWLAADQFKPATIRASVNLEAKQQVSGPLTDEQAAAWTTWHAELLQHSQFQSVVTRRMKERQLNDYADGTKLKARLDGALGIDTTRSGELLLTLSGTDQDETTAVLDVIAAALVTESKEQLSARSGTSTAVIRNGRRVDGQMKYAAIEPVVVNDERMEFAGMLFGGSFAGCLVLMMLFYVKLSRAKRVFEDEDSAFEAAAAS